MSQLVDPGVATAALTRACLIAMGASDEEAAQALERVRFTPVPDDSHLILTILRRALESVR